MLQASASMLLASALPAAIQAAAQGHVEALVALGTSLARRGAPGLSTGMHFSVICAEDMPRLGAASVPQARDFGRGLAPLYEQARAAWPRGAHVRLRRQVQREVALHLIRSLVKGQVAARNGNFQCRLLVPAALPRIEIRGLDPFRLKLKQGFLRQLHLHMLHLLQLCKLQLKLDLL